MRNEKKTQTEFQLPSARLLGQAPRRANSGTIVFQTMDAFSIIRDVEGIFTRYWGGQFEVVTTFFSRPRPREQLIAWLDLQLYKDIHVVP